MQNPVTIRFIKIFQLLLLHNKSQSARQFALSLDFHPQSFHEIIKGRRDVTLELIRKAVIKYPINPEFLLRGIGSPIVGHTDLEPYLTSQNNEKSAFSPLPSS